jgi:hypothetical protein
MDIEKHIKLLVNMIFCAKKIVYNILLKIFFGATGG